MAGSTNAGQTGANNQDVEHLKLDRAASSASIPWVRSGTKTRIKRSTFLLGATIVSDWSAVALIRNVTGRCPALRSFSTKKLSLLLE
jgi:hypothetical protein